MTSLSLKYPAWAEEERVCGISWVGVKTGWQVNSNCPQIFEQLEVLNKLWRWKNRLIVSWILRTLHSKRWRVLQIGRSRSILLSISVPQVREQESWFSDRPQGGILDPWYSAAKLDRLLGERLMHAWGRGLLKGILCKDW